MQVTCHVNVIFNVVLIPNIAYECIYVNTEIMWLYKKRLNQQHEIKNILLKIYNNLG